MKTRRMIGIMMVVLLLAVQNGTALACKINSKHIEITTKIQKVDGEWKPYATVKMKCESDTPGHCFAFVLELLYNGERVATSTGTNYVKGLYSPPNASGTVTAIGYGYCIGCNQVLGSISVASSVWLKDETEQEK